MSIPPAWLPKNTLENRWLAVLFSAFCLFFAFQPAIFSPDTYSYLRADITRFPGYIIYLRGLEALFGNNFSTMAVLGHLLMGSVAMTIFYKNVSQLFHLKIWSRIALLIPLLFPYFKPIQIANNLTSEGLAYPLYLLLISFILDVLFRNNLKKIFPLIGVGLLLTLTRGQFVIIGPIVAFVLLLKHKHQLLRRRFLFSFLLLLLLPIISALADKTYRFAFYGFFETTPYSYVNAVALPLYVSTYDDHNLLETKDHKNVFKASFQHLDSLQLLSIKVEGTHREKYMRFHYNFPQICNQNIHEYGLRYYAEKGYTPPRNAFAIEATCKALFSKLIVANAGTWFQLYFTSIVHGFKSVVALLLVFILLGFSLFRSLQSYSISNSFILLGSLLILSNAMIVAVASHSIMRYLFYNYVIGLLIIILLLKKFIPKNES